MLVFACVVAILLQNILQPFYNANFRNIIEKLFARIDPLILFLLPSNQIKP